MTRRTMYGLALEMFVVLLGIYIGWAKTIIEVHLHKTQRIYKNKHVLYVSLCVELGAHTRIWD